MQLKHTEIPLRFLQQLPERIKYIHRHGKAFLVFEQLYCPKHHSLVADNVHIHGEPSVSSCGASLCRAVFSHLRCRPRGPGGLPSAGL